GHGGLGEARPARGGEGRGREAPRAVTRERAVIGSGPRPTRVRVGVDGDYLHVSPLPTAGGRAGFSVPLTEVAARPDRFAPMILAPEQQAGSEGDLSAPAPRLPACPPVRLSACPPSTPPPTPRRRCGPGGGGRPRRGRRCPRTRPRAPPPPAR